MNWTKAHSKNAVAAKARRRLANASAPEILPAASRVYVPRHARARFTLQIRDHEVGDSLTLRLYSSPWPNCYLTLDGQRSAAQIAKAIRLILTRDD